MSYAVIVPVTATDIKKSPFGFQWLEYFLSRSVKVFMCVNGCSIEEAKAVESFYESMPKEFFIVYGGEEPNPYKARNCGLRAAFAHMEVEAVALIDSESIIDQGFDSCVSEVTDFMLCAGRVKTHVPVGVSRHLDWLAEHRFECFDGFNAPDATMGGNMIIGRSIYEFLGPMKEDSISGGDHEYGARAKARGMRITPIDALVFKIIHKYSYRTIMEKQIRRAKNATLAAQPASEVIPALRAALLRKADAIGGCASIEDLKDNYSKVIDGLFSVMWYESLLASLIDEEPK